MTEEIAVPAGRLARLRQWIDQHWAPGSPGAILLTLLITFFLAAGDAHPGAIVAWLAIGVSAVLLYSYAYRHVIPESLSRDSPLSAYLWKMVILIAGATEIPVMLLVLIVVGDDSTTMAIGFVNFLLQLFITAPVSWMIYHRLRRKREELTVLRKELGQSEANIDFLRTQINPHFLFNALNTLYGIALHEKADRTSEGIQRLGDMMRFMLAENTLERIPLSRELDYLRNYITLQRLRTASSPGIAMDVEIPTIVEPVSIAPMLLIPFVENSFKHGISFLESSYIKVGVELKGNVLYFDVSNSVHRRSVSDPELNSGGIGLANVRQRLALMYPNRHELIVRETSRDFFVHLTVQL